MPTLPHHLFRRLTAVGGVLALGFALLPRVAAADFVWTNAGGDFLWTNQANWDSQDGTPGDDGVPGATDSIVTPSSYSGLRLNGSSFEVTDWTYSGGVGDWTALGFNGSGGASLTISGTLSHDGADTLVFRDSSGTNNPLYLTVGRIEVVDATPGSTTALRLGERFSGTDRLEGLQAGSVLVDGGAIGLNIGGNGGTAVVTGDVEMANGGTIWTAWSTDSFPNHTLQVGSLTSSDTTSRIAANDYGTAATHGTLDLRTNGTATYAGRILDSTGGSATTTMSVEMNGTGTQILTSNTNTYNGDTTVNSGTLLINNTVSTSSGTGNGAVQVNGGTLGGTGYISGGVTVADGGTLLAGDGLAAAEDFTLSGNVTFEAGSLISLTLGGAGAHSTLERDLAGGIWAFDANQLFALIDLGMEAGFYDDIIIGLTGTEAGLGTIANWQVTNADWLGTFTYDGLNNSVDLQLTAVPEPVSAHILAAAAGLTLLIRRRRK